MADVDVAEVKAAAGPDMEVEEAAEVEAPEVEAPEVEAAEVEAADCRTLQTALWCNCATCGG